MPSDTEICKTCIEKVSSLQLDLANCKKKFFREMDECMKLRAKIKRLCVSGADQTSKVIDLGRKNGILKEEVLRLKGQAVALQAIVDREFAVT